MPACGRRCDGARPVVLATGGTGGHVFPAEALAGELEARGVPFALVTDSRGRQWQGALSRRPIHYIHSASPSGSLGQRLMAMMSLGLGLFDAWRALGRIGPSAVVGFGGYASVPTMVAARLRRLPACCTSRTPCWAGPTAWCWAASARIATSFDRTRFIADGDGRARLVGNPVRETVRAAARPALPRAGRGPRHRLVVFGGSQGAASFSQVVPEAILSLPAGVALAHPPGPAVPVRGLRQGAPAIRGAGIVVELAPFFADLPQRLAAAHLVIGRAGASTVAELATIGRPSILVPYPYAADDHQTANARAFEAAAPAS